MFARGMSPGVFSHEVYDMSEKIFYPDADYFGIGRQYRAKFDDMNDANTEYDPDTHCPYDKTLCRQKLVRVQEWKDAISHLFENKVNRQFVTTDNMFHGCPVPEMNCIRRIRYENIVKAIKEIER